MPVTWSGSTTWGLPIKVSITFRNLAKAGTLPVAYTWVVGAWWKALEVFWVTAKPVSAEVVRIVSCGPNELVTAVLEWSVVTVGQSGFSVYPGDKVDLYIYFQDEKKNIYEMGCENVPVLGAPAITPGFEVTTVTIM